MRADAKPKGRISMDELIKRIEIELVGAKKNQFISDSPELVAVMSGYISGLDWVLSKINEDGGTI